MPFYKKHWTLTYFLNKIKYKIGKTKYKDAPWLVFEAIDYLENEIKETDNVFEWGAGRSSIWFAKKCNSIISVEHNIKWYNDLVLLQQNNPKLKNLRLIYNSDNSHYEKIIENYDDNFFDIIIIDGIRRLECANSALNKLKPNGLLIIDNADRYLPSNSITPMAFKNWNNLNDRRWMILENKISKYKLIRFTNGIFDTNIYHKAL
jgi:predicted O-methyltransferase YrrM